SYTQLSRWKGLATSVASIGAKWGNSLGTRTIVAMASTPNRHHDVAITVEWLAPHFAEVAELVERTPNGAALHPDAHPAQAELGLKSGVKDGTLWPVIALCG